MTDHDKLKRTFFAEGQEILDSLDGLLLEWEKDPLNPEVLNSIFRSMHTLKGSCGIFGFDALERVAHFQEDLLDCLRAQRISPTPEIIDILFDSVDQTKVIFEMYKEGHEVDEDMISEIEEKIRGFLPGEEIVDFDRKTLADNGLNDEFVKELPTSSKEMVRQAIESGKRVYQIRMRLNDGCLREGIDPLILIKRLRHDGDVIFTKSHGTGIPSLSELDPTFLYLDDISLIYASDIGIRKISDIFEFALESGSIDLHQFTPAELKSCFDMDIDPFWTESAGSDGWKEGIEGQGGREKGEKVQATQNIKARGAIKIDSERLDSLVDLVGELVIAQTLVAQDSSIKGLADGRIDMNIAHLTKITRNIQDYVMSIRMLPLVQTFQKMSRVVRDVAKKSGKDVMLKISGEDTEVDKTVIDEIGDPLIHILRNAVDHGIERPEIRASHGKAEEGTIELNAYHQGGNVVIEVKDDGRGLSLEHIAKRAREKGLMTDDSNLTDSQIYNLIFEPGFSTSETVTELSGRGVGLDVVKKGMEKLRGTIDVKTTPGSGTVFTIKLPLTLAIIDGMVVTVGDERYIVPTLSVESSLRPAREDMTIVAGRGEMVNVRGNLLPVVRLHDLFNIETKNTDPCEAILIIVESEGKRCCLMVDNIIGHQQAVIKSLGDKFKGLQGISGCTILGDGRVGLILDVGGVIRKGMG